MDDNKLILKLFEIGAIKFGNFTLKSGMQSPHYIDLRLIISYPDILQTVSELMYEKIKDKQIDFICGVPYTALPIATAISLNHNIPMLMRRKEAKKYGTKKCIEGAFNPGDSCIVLEDLFTTGGSALETIEILEYEGLMVPDIVILVDRQQGGVKRVQDKGYNVHVVLTLSDIMSVLYEADKIEQERIDAVKQFAKQNQVSI